MSHNHPMTPPSPHRFSFSRLGLFVGLAAALLSDPAPAQQAAADCDALSVSDERWFCRARQEQREIRCQGIVDADLRATCRAVVTGDAARCQAIRTSERRARCEAALGAATRGAEPAR